MWTGQSTIKIDDDQLKCACKWEELTVFINSTQVKSWLSALLLSLFPIHLCHSRPSTSLNLSEVRKVRFKYEYCNSRHAIATEMQRQETTTDSILYAAEISKRNCIDSKYPSIKTPLARHAHMLAITNEITKRFHLKHGITPLVMLPCVAHKPKRTHTHTLSTFNFSNVKLPTVLLFGVII